MKCPFCESYIPDDSIQCEYCKERLKRNIIKPSTPVQSTPGKKNRTDLIIKKLDKKIKQGKVSNVKSSMPVPYRWFVIIIIAIALNCLLISLFHNNKLFDNRIGSKATYKTNANVTATATVSATGTHSTEETDNDFPNVIIQDFKEIEESVEIDRQIIFSLGSQRGIKYETAQRLQEEFTENCQLAAVIRYNKGEYGSQYVGVGVRNNSQKTVIAYKVQFMFFNDFKENVDNTAGISQQLKISPGGKDSASWDEYTNGGSKVIFIIYQAKYDDDTVCSLGKIEGQETPDRIYIQRINDKGKEYTRKQDFKTAAMYFKKGVELSQSSDEQSESSRNMAYIGLAYCYDKLGKYEEAIKYSQYIIDWFEKQPDRDREIVSDIVKDYKSEIDILKRKLKPIR